MQRSAYLSMALALLFASGAVAEEEKKDDGKSKIEIATIDRKEPVSFEREILPILRSNCLACHSSTKSKGDLNLETPALILEGGEEGPAAVPGKGIESLLVRVAARHEKPFMPPRKNKVGARALTPRELGLIQLWIDQGATGTVSGATAEVEWHPLPSDQAPIYATAVAPDSSFVACGRANQVFIYDVASRQLTTRLTDPQLLEEGPYKRRGIAHLDHVQSLAFHPDGDVLASGGYRCVKIWRRPHARHLDKVSVEGASVRDVAVSMDGTTIAAVNEKGQLTILTAASKEQKTKVDTKQGEVTALGISADGAIVVTAGGDATLRSWNAADGKPLGALRLTKAATGLALCADSKLVVVASGDAKLQVFGVPAEAKDGEEAKPLREFGGHAKKVVALAALSATDPRVVSASEDGTVVFWNASDAKEIRKIPHGGAVRGVAVRSDGARIASLGTNHAIKLWNAADGKLISELAGDYRASRAVARQERYVKLLSLRRDDAKKDVENRTKDRDKKKETVKKAVAERDKQKKALDDKNKALAEAKKGDAKKDKGKIDKAQKEAQNAESAAANAERILKESESDVARAEKSIQDGQAELAKREKAIEAPAKRLEELKKAQSTSAVPSVAVAFTGTAGAGGAERVVSVAENGRIASWDSSSGKPLGIFESILGKLSRLSLGGSTTVVTGDGAELHLIDVDPDWVLERTVGSVRGESPFKDRVTALSFSPDGSQLACGGGEPSRGGEVVVVKLDDGSIAWQLDDAHSDTVSGLEFSPEGLFLASAGADKFARVFQAADGKRVRFYEGHTAHVLDVSWQGDGKTLASCGADNVIKVWNVQTGEVKRTIGGFSKQVTSIRFVGDGQETVSSSGDSSVRMHRTGDGNNFRNFSGAKDYIYSVDVTPDGAIVVAGGHSSVLHLWDGKNAKEIAKIEAPKAAEK